MFYLDSFFLATLYLVNMILFPEVVQNEPIRIACQIEKVLAIFCVQIRIRWSVGVPTYAGISYAPLPYKSLQIG